MIERAIDEVTKSDIDGLVLGKVTERRTLEYKECLPSTSDEDKKEFLYDVSSFANANGGDLIFGISDQKDSAGRATGIPEAALGLEGLSNTSAVTQRLEQILQSGIAPRIPGIQFREIGGFTNGPILVVRIPQSWAAPHMVTYKGVSRFYSRNVSGKFPLDVYQIRSAFALSEAVPERLIAFRNQRTSLISNGGSPVGPLSAPKVILHLVPISALDGLARISITGGSERLTIPLQPLGSPSSWDRRFNFDGFLTFAGTPSLYVQLFRTAAIEAVDAFILDMARMRRHSSPTEIPDNIPTSKLESVLIPGAARYLDVQKNLGIAPPIFLMLSLLGVKGFRVTTRNHFFPFSEHAIEREDLLLPEVMVEDYGQDIAGLLKPVFDVVAQSAGLPSSPNYDSNGKRIQADSVMLG